MACNKSFIYRKNLNLAPFEPNKETRQQLFKYLCLEWLKFFQIF